ncbi:Signal recognition particle receptor subunit alpha [Acipenser ruthenus]|uniref:Signal recognition particle receptor subunit alpha n=1 Tax=Acipenser ruthenus TaxID=7906 RepID=A0A444UWA9_ACIRT|nr:Signal recognition particle receptor subunit alpha [Acipenser ruthenus]
MLDFFTIFSKGGLVLWCFQGVNGSFTGPVNALIRSVILQERSGSNLFIHDALSMKYKLDNEFELVFVVGFQKILTLTYVDKFLDDVQLRFRDRYKNQLEQKGAMKLLNGSFQFQDDFQQLLREAEESTKACAPAPMKTFMQSQKSQKTVKSMIETRGGEKGKEKESNKKSKNAKKEASAAEGDGDSTRGGTQSGLPKKSSPKPQENGNEGLTPEEIKRNQQEFFRRMGGGGPKKPSSKSFRGVFGMLKGLVGSKSLSQEDMEPVLDKLRDHLIAKNVAADIASKLCESVAKKLEGKVMGTFTTVTSTVKQALQDSLVQILQPKRRVDILRDVMEARAQRRPFVVTFCGVNGVGKSTNLAKISFWLIENGFSVLIAACDTFRAGAVEQLRTHQRRLNSMHPPEENGGRPRVQLYEKGYGKDAAGIAMEAIAYARSHSFDVVLVDTAGRMQDNAPLMVALAKLIAVNMPDLVLFVGEALVGNEAVDQLVKFNQALADHSMSDKPRIIDGIVLTKFDTIDDKVCVSFVG